MNLNEDAREAVQNLSEAINSAVERSVNVREAIETLRGIGYEPSLSLKLEVILQETFMDFEEADDDLDLELTDEDLRTLQRMKIRF